MPIDKLVLHGFPGSDNVVDPSIAYVIPLKICRESKEFTIVTNTAPGNMEAEYVAASGRIIFQDAFGGSITTDVAREKIYIKYKL